MLTWLHELTDLLNTSESADKLAFEVVAAFYESGVPVLEAFSQQVDEEREAEEEWKNFVDDHALAGNRRPSDEALVDALRTIGRGAQVNEIAALLIEHATHREKVLMGLALSRLARAGAVTRIAPRSNHTVCRWVAA